MIEPPLTADLAVDWLGDVLFWTNREASEIRRVNLTSTDLPAIKPDVIEVNVDKPRFTDIVLDPVIRYVSSTSVGTISIVFLTLYRNLSIAIVPLP